MTECQFWYRKYNTQIEQASVSWLASQYDGNPKSWSFWSRLFGKSSCSSPQVILRRIGIEGTVYKSRKICKHLSLSFEPGEKLFIQCTMCGVEWLE